MQLKAIFQSAGYQVLHESQQGGNRVQRAGIMSITCFVLKPIFEGTSKMQQISIKLESESSEPKMSKLRINLLKKTPLRPKKVICKRKRRGLTLTRDPTTAYKGTIKTSQKKLSSMKLRSSTWKHRVRTQ